MATETARRSLNGSARDVGDYGTSGRPEWLDIDWHPFLKQVEVDGRAVNYVEMGESDAPPLVFVHGLAGCWQNWLENVPQFSKTHRVIALDLPGFGRSEQPAEQISIPGYARLVDRFSEQLGLGTISLVGNSMGGNIGAELAIRIPERLDRLVLVSAAGISSNRLPADLLLRLEPLIRLSSRPLSPGLRLAIARRPVLRKALLAIVATHGDWLRPELAWELSGGLGTTGFTDACRALVTHPFEDEIPAITAPTLIVWGDTDRLVPVKDAHTFNRLIAGSTKVIMEDTGHVAMLERPARFNKLVGEFLAAA